MGKSIRELGMTRQLAGEHLLMLEGRQRRVLGTKEVTGVGGDTEAFIREHPRQRRLFVNPLYAQVAVDAADIAAEYTALAADARVAKLRFMNREPVRTPK